MSHSTVSGLAPGNEASPKRRQVVEAASELFLAHGYGSVSMDAVARAAGVSKATLYAHFASKDVLFATLMCERAIDNRLDESLFPEQVADLRAALETLGLRVLGFMIQERTLAIYRIALAESVRFPELGRTFYENGPAMFYARARSWLATLQARGLIHAADITVATEQFLALLRSSMFLRATLSVPPGPTEADIAATVRAAVDTWLRAFGANAPAAPGFSAPSDHA